MSQLRPYVTLLFRKPGKPKTNKKNKPHQQEDKLINQNEIEQKLLTLQRDLTYLAEEIDEMVSDFQKQPEKYDTVNLTELMHAHNGEISRIKNEIDEFENRLLVEKSRISP